MNLDEYRKLLKEGIATYSDYIGVTVNLKANHRAHVEEYKYWLQKESGDYSDGYSVELDEIASLADEY